MDDPIGTTSANQQSDEYQVDWADLEAVKKLTGIYANRIYVQPLGSGMVRLNFGEVLDNDDPSYHTALVMTAENAASFGQLIIRVSQSVLDYEAQLSAANASETE